jgi:Zn-dependent peptidase ImmA (M78 family)/transcriptional regulator with XRE-family HTH domain
MTDPRFNPDRLTWARELRGVNQQELAKRAGISQGAISQFENGVREPSDETLAKIAESVRLPTSFFRRPTGRRAIPGRFYRRKASVLRRNVDHLEAELSLLVEHVRVLVRAVDMQSPLSLPRVDLESYGSVPNVASALRSAWGIPSGPIRDLVQFVEAAGVMVIPVHLQFDGVDGIGVRYPGIPPLVFIDANASPDRQRLTLAHEIGHLVMHELPGPDDEDEAKQFQREFLAPEHLLRRELAPVTLPRLGQLKQRWGISMAALLYAARQWELISQGAYITLRNQLRRISGPKREPDVFDIPREQPTLFQGLIDFHLKKLEYSTETLAAALDLLPAEFADRYRADSGTLRLVRE